MKAIVKTIGLVTNKVGRTGAWLSLALVVLICLETILRDVFHSPTSWNYETVLMVGGTLYAFGWAYAQYLRVHIRVDVIYSHFPLRGRAAIDVFGALLFYFPLVGAFVFTAVKRAYQSFIGHERGILSYWYPPLAPLRTVIALAFILLFVQGVAQFISDLHVLLAGEEYD